MISTGLPVFNFSGIHFFFVKFQVNIFIRKNEKKETLRICKDFDPPSQDSSIRNHHTQINHPSHTSIPLYPFKTKSQEEQISDNLQLHKFREESSELSKIANNVIISGIKLEGSTPDEINSNDKAAVNKILAKIGYDCNTHGHYVRIVRLPNSDKKPGTKILITMDDPSNKEIICRNARKLREGNDFV